MHHTIIIHHYGHETKKQKSNAFALEFAVNLFIQENCELMTDANLERYLSSSTILQSCKYLYKRLDMVWIYMIFYEPYFHVDFQ